MIKHYLNKHYGDRTFQNLTEILDEDVHDGDDGDDVWTFRRHCVSGLKLGIKIARQRQILD